MWGVQENGPVHWPADLLVAREPQETWLPTHVPTELV
jgi:hypothetical protein